MKNISTIAIFVGVLLASFGLFGQGAELTLIDDIYDNPGAFIDKLVTVEGTVSSYEKETTTSTSYYILISDYGQTIFVHSSKEKPQINNRYKVTGIVYASQVHRGNPFISEHDREILSGGKMNPLLLGLLATLVVLLILLLVFYMKNEKSVPVASNSTPTPTKHNPPISTEQVDDFKTIRIQVAPPTIRLITGKLEIISSGADKGKQFSIAGQPTAEGNIVTIGRAEVNADIAYSHIQLSGYNTVSRQQAELIEKNQKLFIANKSETNPTELNGKPLKSGEPTELKATDRLKMGELELTYIV